MPDITTLGLANDADPFAMWEIEDRSPETVVGQTEMVLETLSTPIQIVQDASGGCGGKIWEAANVMVDYLTLPSKRDIFRGKRVIEVGSGTGLVGLAIAKACPNLEKLVLTDQQPMLELMRQNIIINNVADIVRAEVLNWGEPIPETMGQGSPDFIIASDCVYLEGAFQPLIDTLVALADQHTCIYLCYRKRRKADKRFFTLARKKLIWSEVNDDPKHDLYARQGIHLYQMYKKP